ncbi:hypothetical protein AVEN_4263-1 [Araneus ventricosus]|uniref:Uncharacterized protein n=1 Tax=Araneus ventricosus TaxID=182803 RepID=A0A4Y2HH78_ARAVE|nr:hypothetical protein AVEN_4263-1 [Araneus ventricosus]
MLSLHFFRSSRFCVYAGARCNATTIIIQGNLIFCRIFRGMCSLARFPFFNLSKHESCERVWKGDFQSENGCDSGLMLELEVERRNFKYDLERRGCCGSVCS